jgi:phosphohistidine phosphatase SixA
MRRVALALLCSAVCSCGGATSPAGPSETPAGLVPLVARGNHVVFFRHAQRDASAISDELLLAADRRGDCLPGTELTPQGIDDAVAIGAAFRRLAIRIEQVYASPTCRTQQMADLAFGKHVTTAGLAWPELWHAEESATLMQVLPRLLGDPLPAGATRVLISHNGVLVPTRMGLDIMLDQAEAAVFRPTRSGGFEFVGRIPQTEWLAAPRPPARESP